MFIDQRREVVDSEHLIQQLIMDHEWYRNVTLVNCSPEYSSRLTQLINHKTSYLNQNFLLDQLSLYLPVKGVNQFWDIDLKNYVTFDYYLNTWVRNNIYPEQKYLFITNSIFTGKHLNKLRLILKGKLEPTEYKFACLYAQEGSMVKPDYFIRKFNSDVPLFFWENTNK